MLIVEGKEKGRAGVKQAKPFKITYKSIHGYVENGVS